MNSVSADAVYIHVPFCVRKCGYCDFYSLAGNQKLIPDYIAALKNEIRAAASLGKPSKGQLLRSIYFGGGTPNLLPSEKIGEVIELIDDHIGLAEDCEITLEANPETLDQYKINHLADFGINRLSVGLQAVQNNLLKSIGRMHTAEDFKNAVLFASEAGIDNISADLMLGLPGQSIEDLDESISYVLSLPIKHVSCYSLIIEPDTPFFDMYSNNTELLPDDEMERKMYHHMIKRLAAAGMPLYEISNAAVPGYESRHNLVYWHAREYYGFGPSAHSYLAGVRRGNPGDIHKYINTWKIENQPFAGAIELERVDETSMQREMLMLGLRLLDGVSFAQFRERFGTDMKQIFNCQLQMLEQKDLIYIDEKSVRLSEKGLDFANQVFMEFV